MTTDYVHALSPIRNENDYELALAALQEMSKGAKTKDDAPDAAAYRRALATLVGAYERENFPIPLADPIKTIEAALERLNWKQRDLADAVNVHESKISEVLHRRRRLSLDLIRKLAETLNLPLEVLAQEYPTDADTVHYEEPLRPTASATAVQAVGPDYIYLDQLSEGVALIEAKIPESVEWVDLTPRGFARWGWRYRRPKGSIGVKIDADMVEQIAALRAEHSSVVLVPTTGKIARETLKAAKAG